ncbi:MAG: hypothetical protein HYS86_02825 [Candidatus Chisholmbacteria bacterium]|nr:hypothetical protein [Candidatus Chisholmbacteria bacterium]
MAMTLRTYWWLVTSFTKKHRLKIIITAIITAAIAAFTPSLLSLIPSGKPHYKIGLVGQYTVADLPLSIQNLVSLGLTTIAPDGSAAPALAQNWRVSDDGTTYTFSLDPSYLWQDGLPLQAAHINYALPDISININSATEIEFKLKEPFAPFPTIVSTPIFREVKTISTLLRNTQQNLVGTATYHLKNIKYRGQFLDSIVLESTAEKRTYRFYTTERAAILAFKLGEVQSLDHLAETAELASWPNVQIQSQTHLDRYVAIFFNTSDPLLSDKNVRQALAYAIPDKAQGGERALGPLHPQSWAFNSQVKDYSTDIPRAKELLDEAVGGNDDINRTIRLYTTLAYLDTAEKIKAAWKELGIDADIRVINSPPEEYQALLVVHQIPPDPDQYTLWHSTQESTNITKLKDPRIDKLLEDGRKTTNLEERQTIYQDFQRFLLEESPAVFLFYQTTYTISRK